MFGNFSEQFQQSAKPARSIVALNAKTIEALAKQQAAFVSGVLSDSVKLVNFAAKQQGLRGFIAAQSQYSESVRDRVTTATSGTLATLSAARDDISAIMSASLQHKSASNAPKTEAAAKPVSKPVSNPVGKPAPKTTAKAAAKPVAKPKSAAKPATKAKAPSKTATKAKTAKPKPAAKTAE
ncbi:phasin family protein [Alteromonas sp. ASW11-36]|uniref:Phasin family protein n=1 Tax=Alteromonas arenosi TaxID=3055817 RepID=A0ABT7T1F3_9ALTE|nr:phasin family protein [Alteromonas sp. ASW11-36]MDM7862285.1 phasin family protein [Alteromonas sp. ASW11-36]